MKERIVAIYARVSTEHEAQLSALENQVQYYDNLMVLFGKLDDAFNVTLNATVLC